MMDDCESLDRFEQLEPEQLEPGGRTLEPGSRPWGPLPARHPPLLRSQRGSMERVWGSGREAGSPARAEDRLACLAAAVGPLRRVLSAIAERLIETSAHERLCYARLSDYARERLGLSARQLQELARVHRALGALPSLERALVANELSWSKLRLVTRVAKPEDEQAWIARARALPVRQLEREVRASAAHPGPELPDDGLPRQRVTLRCTPSVLEKWHLARELAERVAARRLSAAEALELVSAISIDPAFAELSGESSVRRRRYPDGGTEGEVVRTPRAPRAHPPQVVASLFVGLEEADAFELDRRLRLAVWLEQTLDAKIAPLLRVVSCAEYEWSGPYQPLSSYAPEQLGMSARKARALLRLERAEDVCPELRRAYRAGQLSWVKAQCLAPLLLLDIEGEWRPAWAAWAQSVTLRRLAEDVQRALLLRAGHSPAWQRCKFHPEKALDPIPASERQLCAHDVDTEATQQLVWRLPPDVATLFHAVRETLRLRLAAEHLRATTDGEVFEALLEGAMLAWTLRVRGRAPDDLVFELGVRAQAPPLVRYHSGDVAISPTAFRRGVRLVA